MRPDQVEPSLLARTARGAGEVELVPGDGVGGLGVPPHGVVVEMADHMHGPAGLGDYEVELGGEPASIGLDDRPSRLGGTRRCCPGVDCDLDTELAVFSEVDRSRHGQARSFDIHVPARVPDVGDDPDNLTGCRLVADEQLGALR